MVKIGGNRRRGIASLPRPPITLEELKALYDECNESRFGGRLPKARQDWREPSPRASLEWQHPPAGLVASTHSNAALGPSIWISPVWAIGRDADWVRRVLLHEMCHVEVGLLSAEEDEHGPYWQAAMARLYERGESWVAEDLRKMTDRTAEEERLLGLITDEMKRIDPRLPWPRVVAMLVKKLGKKRSTRWPIQARDLIERSPRVYLAWLELRPTT